MWPRQNSTAGWRASSRRAWPPPVFNGHCQQRGLRRAGRRADRTGDVIAMIHAGVWAARGASRPCLLPCAPRRRRSQLPLPLLPNTRDRFPILARQGLSSSQMPKPRARQLLAGAAGPAEQAAPAAVDGGSGGSDRGPSEPHSPALRDGLSGDSDADSLLGWKAAPSGALADGDRGSSGACVCHLAGGPTPEEAAESKRVRLHQQYTHALPAAYACALKACQPSTAAWAFPFGP